MEHPTAPPTDDLRGSGMKGPVLEIKKRLSEQMPVSECSEFRTSKLCLDCGREVKDYDYGVTYCTERDHHRMANRDVSAARKIGERVEPRSRGVSSEAVQLACEHGSQRRAHVLNTQTILLRTC